jgi:superfamily II DNA or RNA helicase
MFTVDDGKNLERLVGSVTYVRGREYAQCGAVDQQIWNESGTQVVGRVRGSALRPYVVSVTLTRSASNHLTKINASCSCPVMVNCKHAVALILASDPEPQGNSALGNQSALAARHTIAKRRIAPSKRGGVAPRVRPAKRAGRSKWEESLTALLDSEDSFSGVDDEPQIGLQFELLRPKSGPRPGETTIRIRPVQPGGNGNWIKTGISWAKLDYFSYRMSRTPRSQEHLAVLKELRALSRLATGASSWGYSNEVVSLESISSRRLWDVLGAARAAGIPMMLPGRPGEPVTIITETVSVTLNVSRDESGLLVVPRLDVGGANLAVQHGLFIGNPAHGLAFWTLTSGATSRPSNFGLAEFATPLSDQLRGLLSMGALEVPVNDEARFLDEYVPRLRRSAPVESFDHSVELPSLQAPTLVLRVQAGDDHQIDLSWSRRVDGITEREGQAPSSTGAFSADDAVISAIISIVRVEPALIVRTPFGDRLTGTGHLDGMNAVRFVTEFLPALELLEGVTVEQVGTLVEYREALDAPVVHIDGSDSSDSDWFDLSVTVSVGDEDVPFAQLFRALAVGDSHLVLPSGTFFSLDREDLQSLAHLIAEARALDDSHGDIIRLSRFQVSFWEELERLGVLSEQAAQWESSVRALSTASDRTEFAVPETLEATLRPYQVDGFNWLAYLYDHQLGGVLADDMGLGKTLQALALICHVRERGLSDAPFLVVAPTSVVGNWARECQRFAPHLVVAQITETGRRREQTLGELAASADVVVTSYSLFRLEYEPYAAITWSGLFLDEAQFAKNRHSLAYQKTRSLPVRYKIAMSGTPIENNLMELWSLLSIAAPGLFASPDRFSEYYRLPIEKHADADRLAQLRRRIRPLLLRRTKEQVERDLPDKLEQILELDLNAKHQKIYQRYLQRERQKVLGLLDDVNKNRFAIFRSLTLLRQASLDVGLVDEKHASVPSTKLDALMEMLDDIVSDGHRVLVFSQFTRFLTSARTRIRAAGIDHCYLDGRTRKREAVINSFRDGVAPVFLISLKAGGFGLNLTEADYCVLLDPWWNPATEAQAVDRVHRIGQTKKVMVYRLVAKDTIEEKVMALKEKKAALFASVMDDGGFESGAMTAADIRSLLD